MIKYAVMFQLIVPLVCFIGDRKKSEKILQGAVFLSVLTAIAVTFFMISQLISPISEYLSIYDFVTIKNVRCEFGLLSDSLSIVSTWVICIITAIANCYSLGYVKKNLGNFLFRLNLLPPAAILFTASNNLLQMYVFWEILVIISYFLVAFNDKCFSSKTALEMFAHNKFGNIGFIISMAALFHVFGNLDFGEMNKFLIGNDAQLKKLEIIATIMLLSICIKSAQIISSNWIQNIMCAPMSASALVHSSTLLTAGVFLLIRLQSLFECSELIQNFTIIIGLFSAVMYSIKAIFSDSLHKIFAHSTCSQIGLMIMACGFSSYGAALILFVSHAFSKASLLFSTGSVIYALSGERDMRRMGGLFELLPKTYISFILGVVSMIGIPLLPSYYSRKILLNEIMGSNLSICDIALIFIIIVSILTSVYLFRMVYMIFHGKTKLTEISLAYLNEDESFIIHSLYVSVFFAIFSGVFFYYAMYDDAVWKDVFAFSYAKNNYKIFVFSVINFIGIAVAIPLCKLIKSRNLSPKFDWNIDSHLKTPASKLIRSIDSTFYKKCYLFVAHKSKRNSDNAGK
ncbi:MAG: hypothetical protein LBF44_01555 [Holosporaceae bacterium]|jgi:NADH-quinone oxidoreductase subunit L|nr:hypothetical protein [Holosporaceae bacterium]